MQYTAVILSVITLLIVMAVLGSFSRKLKKLRKDNLLDELRSEVDELILELNQTADRNISLLENRVQSVSQLVADVDKRLKLLRRESEKIKTEPVVYNQLGKVAADRPSEEAVGTKKNIETNRREHIIELHKNGFSSAVIASRVGATVGEIELVVSLLDSRQDSKN